MRIVLVGLASILATSAVLGQGTVTFDNRSIFITSPPDRLVRYDATAHTLNAANATGGPVFTNASNPGLRAQLYFGLTSAAEGSLVAATEAPCTFNRPGTSLNIGTWVGGGTRDLTGFTTNDDVQLQARVWDSAYATSYDDAISQGQGYLGLKGKSATFTYKVPTGVGGPEQNYMTNFNGFSLDAPSVIGAPFITHQPQSLVKVIHTSATFAVTNTGLAPFTYQWRTNGVNIPTKTDSFLTIANPLFPDAASFDVVITGSSSITSLVATLTVICPTITFPGALPDGHPSVAYSQSVAASGGTPAYIYSVSSGALPGGLALTPGLISGTPTNTGSFSFTIQAIDSDGCIGTSNYTVNVTGCPTITFSPASLPGVAVTSNYNKTISASGGVTPYTFTTNSGSVLPPGVTLSSGGVVSGVPTLTGTYAFSVHVVDSNGCPADKAYSITVSTPDGVAPKAAITLPKSKTDVAGTVATVTGTAVDAHGISDVIVYANGVSPTAATVTPGATPAKPVTWTANLPINVGTNYIFAKAVDGTGMEGFSKTNTAIFGAVAGTLTLGTNGVGMGDLVASAAKPPTAPPFYVGRTYIVAATPVLNVTLFSNIVSVGSSSGTSILTSWNSDVKPTKWLPAAFKGVKKIAFLMETNLTLTGNFISNRFNNVAGDYYGLFSETANPAHESAGWFKLTAKSTAKFSGKVQIEGETVAMSGEFDLAGLGLPKKNVIRKGLTNEPLIVKLQLDLATGAGVTGSVSNTVALWSSDLLGDHVAASIGSQISTPFGMVMTAGSTPNPAGDGYLYGTASSLPIGGTMKAKGYSGDGIKIAATTTGVSTNGDWPFYAPVHITSRAAVTADATGNLKTYKGSMWGWLNVSNGIVRGDVFWSKPSGMTNVTYTAGFTNVHSYPSTLISSPNTGPGLISGTITISDGNLAGPIVTNYVFASPKITVDNTKLNGITAGPIKPTTLEVGGKINKVPGTKWFGVYLPEQGVIRGVFVGTTESGSVRLQ